MSSPSFVNRKVRQERKEELLELGVLSALRGAS
jgi:hypothetical protein